MTKTQDETQETKVDLYRDTPVRYLGYANEVGEAFRSMIGPRWVSVSYGIAISYVLADTISKTKEVYIELQNKEKQLARTAYIATDTIVWQMLASVAIPGYAINRTCAFVRYVLTRHNMFPSKARNWVVTGVGLAFIPFIIRPIDFLVDEVLDVTLRKLAP